MVQPKAFRQRQRVTSIQTTDVFPLSRMVGEVAVTFSIEWGAMSAQIVQEVDTARQDMVTGFSNTIAWVTAELVTKAALVHTHSINDVTGLSAALSGLSGREPVIVAGTTGQYWRGDKSWQPVAGLPISTATQAALDAKLAAFNNGAAIALPKFHYASKALSTAGTVAIYLTSDGTAGGAAIFGTEVLNVQPVVSDATTMYAFAWTVSGDRKTLTMTVNKSATPLLSLLGLNILAAPTAAPIGTVVQVIVLGR